MGHVDILRELHCDGDAFPLSLEDNVEQIFKAPSIVPPGMAAEDRNIIHSLIFS